MGGLAGPQIHRVNQLYQAGAVWEVNTPQPAIVELEKELKTPGFLLEVSCGSGHNSIHFAKRGYVVTGIDFSFQAIQRARRNLARSGVFAHFILMNAASIGSVGEKFNYILECGFLHMLPIHERVIYDKAIFEGLNPVGKLLSLAIRRSVRTVAGKIWKPNHERQTKYQLSQAREETTWLCIYDKTELSC